MTAEPECPAPPCLDLEYFLGWAKEHAARIAELRFIWHEPSLGQSGFRSRSHIVACDEHDTPLQCAQLVWGEPRNIDDIERFRVQLQQFVERVALDSDR